MTGGVRPRATSPSYPSLDLRAALDRLRRLVALAPGGTADALATHRALGYAGPSGPARRAVSALAQYGLLEGRDRGHAATPLGLAALPPGEAARAARRAAMTGPAAYAAMADLTRATRSRLRRDPTPRELVEAALGLGYALPGAVALVAGYRASLAWVEAGAPPHGEAIAPPVHDDDTVDARSHAEAPVEPLAPDDADAGPGAVDAEGGEPYRAEARGDVDAPATVEAVAPVPGDDRPACHASGATSPYEGLRRHPVSSFDLMLAGVASVDDLVERTNAARRSIGRDPVDRDEFPVRRRQFEALASQLSHLEDLAGEFGDPEAPIGGEGARPAWDGAPGWVSPGGAGRVERVGVDGSPGAPPGE